MPAFSNYAQDAMVSARRSILRFVAFVGIVASPSVFAAVDVTASVPSGTYDRIVSVELRATDPTAKIFYTFEPDGPPDAGYMYTGAIRIARSTPLMFFAVVSDDDSSLIKREDYVLAYPRAVSMVNISPSAFGDAGHASYSVRNASSATVDLGGWYFRLASWRVVLSSVPAGTAIAAGESRSMTVPFPTDYPREQLADSETVELVAPDGTVVATALETIRFERSSRADGVSSGASASSGAATRTGAPSVRPAKTAKPAPAHPVTPWSSGSKSAGSSAAPEPTVSAASFLGESGSGVGPGTGASIVGTGDVDRPASSWSASVAATWSAQNALSPAPLSDNGIVAPPVRSDTPLSVASARDSGGAHAPFALVFMLGVLAIASFLRAFRKNAEDRLSNLRRR